MINNRQGGRRRGRGGSGGGPPRSNNPGPGNRQDNRQRGNAAQLLEKYKGLARDAQMQGDRVQTETYLQYADHYYRVLNESRARFEEQRRPREDEYGDEDADQDAAEAAETNERDTGEEADMVQEADTHREDRRPQGNGEFRGRPRRERHERDDEAGESGEERIALDALPPAISAGGDEGEAEPRAPRRRARRPRDPGEDIAPAA